MYSYKTSSDGFLADSVDTTLAVVYVVVQKLQCSMNCTISWRA